MNVFSIFVKFIINIIAVVYVVFDETFVFISNKIGHFIDKYKLFLKLTIVLKSLNKYVILSLLISMFIISELIGI